MNICIRVEPQRIVIRCLGSGLRVESHRSGLAVIHGCTGRERICICIGGLCRRFFDRRFINRSRRSCLNRRFIDRSRRSCLNGRFADGLLRGFSCGSLRSIWGYFNGRRLDLRSSVSYCRSDCGDFNRNSNGSFGCRSGFNRSLSYGSGFNRSLSYGSSFNRSLSYGSGFNRSLSYGNGFNRSFSHRGFKHLRFPERRTCNNNARDSGRIITFRNIGLRFGGFGLILVFCESFIIRSFFQHSFGRECYEDFGSCRLCGNICDLTCGNSCGIIFDKVVVHASA